jgi:hypothetical protein
MPRTNTTTRKKRKTTIRRPDLFTWAQDTTLLSNPVIRAIVRRAQVSPATAALIAELSGLGREAANV